MIAEAKPKQVPFPVYFNMKAQAQALKLETLGMRHSSGRSVAVVIRQLLKDAGRPAPVNKVKLLAEFTDYLKTVTPLPQ